MMRKFILLFFLIVCARSVHAYDFIVDGIAYNVLSVTELTAEVTYTNVANSYSGDVTIPAYVEYQSKRLTVTQIGNQSFYLCKSLTSISLPNTITNIVGCAFEGCSSLQSIILPNSVRSVGSFDNCTSLIDLRLNEAVEVLPTLRNCKSLKTLVIPKNIVKIPRQALEGTSINNLYIEDGTTLTVYADYTEYRGETIHYGSFCGHIDTLHLDRKINAKGYKDKTDNTNSIFPYISNLVVGQNVDDITRIDYGWYGLNSIQLLCDEPPSIPEQTNEGYLNTQVTVPCGSLDKYKSHSIWGKFWNMKECDNSDGIINISTYPIFITYNGHSIHINGLQNVMKVHYYSMEGKCLGSSLVKNKETIFETNMPKGSVVIIRTDEKSLKLLLK